MELLCLSCVCDVLMPLSLMMSCHASSHFRVGLELSCCLAALCVVARRRIVASVWSCPVVLPLSVAVSCRASSHCRVGLSVVLLLFCHSLSRCLVARPRIVASVWSCSVVLPLSVALLRYPGSVFPFLCLGEHAKDPFLSMARTSDSKMKMTS